MERKRRKLDGTKRTLIGVSVRPELRAALEAAAAERGITLSTYAADKLGESMGVPA